MYKRKQMMSTSSSRLAKSKKYRGSGLYGGRGLYYGRGKYRGQNILTKAGNTIVKFLKKNKTAQMGYDMGLSMAAQQAGVQLPQKQYGSSQFMDQPFRPTTKPVQESIEGQGLYTGKGMYSNRTIYTNDLFSDTASMAPKFSTVKDETGAMIITHQEYIGEVYGNSVDANNDPNVFEYSKYILNPGMEKTFPWLSQIAVNYQEYEFKQLVFSYRPSLADINSNNGQVGEVLIATNYRATDPSFQTKADIKRYPHHSSSRCLDAQDHGVECDKKKLPLAKNVMYVRNESLSSQENINDYDLGFTQISVHNTPSSVANAALGSLYVYYQIKLIKPILKSSKGLAISRATFSTGILSTAKSFVENGTFPVFWRGINNNTALEPVITKAVYPGSTNVSAIVDPGIKKFLDSLFAQISSEGYEIQVGNPQYYIDHRANVETVGLKLIFPASYSGFVTVRIIIHTVPDNWKSTLGGTNFDKLDGQNMGYFYLLPITSGNITLLPAHASTLTHVQTNQEGVQVPNQSVSQLMVASIRPAHVISSEIEFCCTIRVDNADKFTDNILDLIPARLGWSTTFSGFSQKNIQELNYNGLQVIVEECNPQLADYETLQEPLYELPGKSGGPKSFFEIVPTTIDAQNDQSTL
jgi:hypothetical protein